MNRIRTLGIAILGAIALVPAVAQEQVDLVTTGSLDLDSDVVDEAVRPWDLRIGILAALGPDFEGTDEYELDAVPYVLASWRERIILRGRSLEANLYRANGLRFGPMIKTRGGRKDSKADFLRGMGDVDRAFEAGGFVRYATGPIRLGANALADFSDAHDGTVVEIFSDLRSKQWMPWGSLRVMTTWARSNYMTTYFGIDPVQSRRSGLPQFDADAGFKDVRISLGSRVPLVGQWSGLVSVSYVRLLGDAADTPLVDDHGDANQYIAALGVSYEF